MYKFYLGVCGIIHLCKLIPFNDMSETTVIFRKFKDGEIIALFPYIIGDSNNNVLSYMICGQHGSADYHHIVRNTKLAKPKEYKEIFDELTNHFGYNLIVKKRMFYDKFLSAVRKVIR